MVLRQAQVKLWHLRADAWCCRTIGLRQAIDGMAVFREIQWIGLRENRKPWFLPLNMGLWAWIFPHQSIEKWEKMEKYRVAAWCNACKAIIVNHPQNFLFYRCYEPSTYGWFMALLYHCACIMWAMDWFNFNYPQLRHRQTKEEVPMPSLPLSPKSEAGARASVPSNTRWRQLTQTLLMLGEWWNEMTVIL